MPGVGRSRILIVEDDQSLAREYREALREVGDCEIAERADAVFSALSRFDPHAILLDIVLEGETAYDPSEAGLKILERIRNFRPPFGEIPVIVISGSLEDELEDRCRRLGVLEFLPKHQLPLDKLLSVVDSALAQRRDLHGRHRIFISCLKEELKVEPWVVKRAIRGLGADFHPEAIGDYAERPEPRSELGRQAAAECDRFILLLGEYYGPEADSSGVSALEREYEVARRAGKPILVFARESTTREPRLEAFLIQLRRDQGDAVVSYRDSEHLFGEVQRKLQALAAEPGGSAGQRPAPSVAESPVGADKKAARDSVFISYAREDRQWLDRFATYLKPYERQERLRIWSDVTGIRPGDPWEDRLRSELDRARVALLIVTPHFVASDFIVHKELPYLIEAAQSRELTILWVAVSASGYDLIGLDRYQCLNNPQQPLDGLSEADLNSVMVDIGRTVDKRTAGALRESPI